MVSVESLIGQFEAAVFWRFRPTGRSVTGHGPLDVVFQLPSVEPDGKSCLDGTVQSL
jgi:hypothetical protein